MRGTRAKALRTKALRTADRPNPGRRGGGATKDQVVAAAQAPRLTRAMRRSGWFRKMTPGSKNGKTRTDG